MKLEAAIKEIGNRMGPPKPRAAYGQWVPYAWIVRGLVEAGHGVMDAVRSTVDSAKLHPPEVALKSVRAAYYKIRHEEWPADMATRVTGDTEQPEETEEFEV